METPGRFGSYDAGIADMAKYVQADGNELTAPHWPFELLFVPDASLQENYTDATYMSPQWQDQVVDTLKAD